MFLYDSTSLVTLRSFLLLNNLFHFRIRSFYLSGDPLELLCFCIVNKFCWNCLVYCFQNFLFEIYPDLISIGSKLNFVVTSTQVYICYVLSEVCLSPLLYKNIVLGGFFILSGLRLESTYITS